MKKYFIAILLAGSIATQAQEIEAGVIAGLNYGSTGDLKEIVTAGNDLIESKGQDKIGYHIGGYLNVEFSGFFIRPELTYSTSVSEYDVAGNQVDYSLQTLNLPILAGVEIIGPLYVFAGPSFQYVIENDFSADLTQIDDIKNNFTLGANLGVGIKLGNLALDVRYDRAITDNEATFTGASENYRLDSRPEQILFSLRVKL